MNRSLTKISTVIILSLSVSLPIVADQEYLEVDSFDGVDIGTGMVATVSCDSKNTVTLHGDKKDLDLLEVTVKGSKLDISRRTSASRIFNNIFSKEKHNNSIRVEITTNGHISSIDASTGATITVPGCAVNSSFVDVDTSTGSIVNIEGNTAVLELDLSTGSMFNQNSKNFTVDVANVDLSTGAIAKLCGAMTVRGDASTGAIITVSDTTEADSVDLSTGAEVSRSCR